MWRSVLLFLISFFGRGKSGPMPDPSRVRRVLLINARVSLAEVLLASPIAAALKEAYPRAEVDWILPPEFAPVFSDNSKQVRVIEFGLDHFWEAPSENWQRLRSLRERNYDLALDGDGSDCIHADALLLMLLLKISVRIGARERAEWAPLYTVALPTPPIGTHEESRKRALLPASYTGEAKEPWLAPPTQKARVRIQRWWRTTQLEDVPVLFLWPGAAAPGSVLPESFFVTLLNALELPEGWRAILVGGEAEWECAAKIAGGAGVILAPATDPVELAVILQKGRAFVGTPGGASIMAAALGLATFTLLPDESALRRAENRKPHRAIIMSAPPDPMRLSSLIGEWLRATLEAQALAAAQAGAADGQASSPAEGA